MSEYTPHMPDYTPRVPYLRYTLYKRQCVFPPSGARKLLTVC
jgi:hypothetical protein